ncbi:MAG: flagellar hook-basal body complex protein FliE [Gammaproteobacteria bacterium]|nr:flagellar hook-basal body complex protein FliE [Gammaproteobacteria bacterium]
MSEIDTSRLLSEMRAMAAVVRGSSMSSEPTELPGDFAALIKQSIDHANAAQKAAAGLAKSYELEEANVNLAEVMISMQKANVAFQAMVQVRNKLVSAYQEIMSMQV